MDDRAILVGIRSGDESAFDTLFREFYPQLVGFAESLLHVRQAAEEVVQDVLLEVWKRRDNLVLEESWRAYLFRATRNRALNELRHERVKLKSEPLIRGPDAVEPTSQEEMEAGELDVAFRRALAALPEPVRDVFEMSRRDGLKYGEIAKALGISVKTVEARMGKALKQLREQLADWLPG
jgi:RNA polymerase sigma-70 factor (ECF subfamily)